MSKLNNQIITQDLPKIETKVYEFMKTQIYWFTN